MLCRLIARLLVLLPMLWLAQGIAQAGTLLVANKAEGSVTLLRSPGFERLATLPTGLGPHEIALSPEGLRALVSNYGSAEQAGSSLTLLDLAKLRAVATIELPPGSRPHGLAWISADKAVVTAEGLRELLLIDVAAAELSQRIPIDQEGMHMLTVSRDGQRAWVANLLSGTVSAIDLVSFKKLGDAASGAGAEGIALVRDGRELWVSNREADTISVFDALTLDKLADIPALGFPIRLESDERRGLVFASLARADAMAVIDVQQRKLIRRIEFDIAAADTQPSMLAADASSGSVPVGLKLTGAGDFLIVAHSNAHLLSAWDPSKLELLQIFSAGQEPDGMAWTWIDLPLR